MFAPLLTPRYTIRYMEPNIPTPLNVPPSQRTQGASQSVPGSPAASSVALPNIIRTMKSDAALAVKNQNETLVSMSLAEEKKKAARREEIAAKEAAATPETKSAPKPIGRVVLVLGLVVVVVGVGFGIYFALPTLRNINLPSVSLPTFGTPDTERPAGVTPTSKTPLAPSLISARSEKRFSVNKETPEHLFAMVAVERTAGVTPGSVRNLYFTEDSTSLEGTTSTASISANRLLILTETVAPAILARSLENSFMAGLYGEEGAQATPFFVFKFSGYDTGLAGMLAWEKELPRFFDTIFGTKFLATPSTPVKFRDAVVSGYDTRALEGLPAGSIVYTFVNPTTVVIAGSRSTLEALIPLVPAR